MNNHAVNVNRSNNILGKIKEELSRFFSVISYANEYEPSEDEYMDSSLDAEIIKELKYSEEGISDFDSFVNKGRKSRKVTKSRTNNVKPPRSSILHIQDSGVNELKKDDGRTL